jgi:uncharacterized protein (DUF427 family)
MTPAAGTLDNDMSSGHTVTTAPANAHVEVRLGGELLASSDRAVRLDETGLPPRYYLPKADVRMDLLEATTFHTTCPFKGEASYWSADIGGQRHDGIVWAYESPLANVGDIEGHLSFYPDRATVTVDGERLA